MIITIEGKQGEGKTKLAEKLAQHMPGKTHWLRSPNRLVNLSKYTKEDFVILDEFQLHHKALLPDTTNYILIAQKD